MCSFSSETYPHVWLQKPSEYIIAHRFGFDAGLDEDGQLTLFAIIDNGTTTRAYGLPVLMALNQIKASNRAGVIQEWQGKRVIVLLNSVEDPEEEFSNLVFQVVPGLSSFDPMLCRGMLRDPIPFLKYANIDKPQNFSKAGFFNDLHTVLSSGKFTEWMEKENITAEFAETVRRSQIQKETAKDKGKSLQI